MRVAKGVAVEPGGDAEALAGPLRIAFHHPESGTQPVGLAESVGFVDEPADGVVQLGVGPPGHPGTQVRGFHRPGPAAGHHQLAPLGELLGDVGDIAVGGVGAPHCVAAHHADDAARFVSLQETVHRLADGVVVERAGERHLEVAAPPAVEAVVGIGLAVIAAVVRPAVGGVETFVEGSGIVELAPDLVAVHKCGFTYANIRKKRVPEPGLHQLG